MCWRAQAEAVLGGCHFQRPALLLPALLPPALSPRHSTRQQWCDLGQSSECSCVVIVYMYVVILSLCVRGGGGQPTDSCDPTSIASDGTMALATALRPCHRRRHRRFLRCRICRHRRRHPRCHRCRCHRPSSRCRRRRRCSRRSRRRRHCRHTGLLEEICRSRGGRCIGD